MAKVDTTVKKPRIMRQNDRVLNCIPSRETYRDWRFRHAVGAGDVLEPAGRGSIPKSRDLREDWWDIGDQERTGSCVGWATADSVLRWHFVKARRLARDTKLSVRFVWMSAKETDEYNDYPSTFLELEGTSLKAALDIARNYGSVEDSVLPFQPEKLYDDEPETFLAKASRFKIRKYINLSNSENEPPDWDKVRSWIANKGPVLTRLDVDETWFENESGVLDVYKNPYNAGHAVALVGYTPETFIVRNSWGTEWGDLGYGHASLDYAKDAFTEAYGVTIIP